LFYQRCDGVGYGRGCRHDDGATIGGHVRQQVQAGEMVEVVGEQPSQTRPSWAWAVLRDQAFPGVPRALGDAGRAAGEDQQARLRRGRRWLGISSGAEDLIDLNYLRGFDREV